MSKAKPPLKTSLLPLAQSKIEDVPVVVATLTRQQKAAVRACVDYMRQNDQLPGHEALAALLGLSSPNAARHYFKTLQKAGLLEPNEVGKMRFSRVEGMSVFDVLKNQNLCVSLVGLQGLNSWGYQLLPAEVRGSAQQKGAQRALSQSPL